MMAHKVIRVCRERAVSKASKVSRVIRVQLALRVHREIRAIRV
jgi:hypothetical protein